ncbi:MAG: cation:proton antiporter [Candidatus Methanomethylophilaceae archaeon]|nr:cation:proton antiporter [Candidatus Methanomethylophilaceae archaeon]
MEEEVLITIMAILIVLAAFTSIILSKLKLPSLVGFLITGIIIANYIELPSVTDEVVSMFSNLGLIMLMFAIGMEIDISKLKTQGRFAVLIAIIQIPIMLFAGMIAGSAMGYDSVQSITLGAILSGASTAVVLAVLKANKVLDHNKMDILILVMIIEDISQVIMISVLTPMMQGSNMSTDSLVVLIINIAAFMFLCFFIGLRIMPRLINWIYERSNDELISLLCVGLVFVFALLAHIIGLSVAIGAFLAGVMIGMSRPKHVVERFIDPLKTLFMAIFFISVGMEVSVDSLFDNIPMIITIYVIFAICMFIAVNTGYWVANGDSRSGWISAMAMCTMGEFAFIISKQALDFEVFDNSFYSSIIGAAILSMIILPMLVRTSNKTYDAINKICPGFIRRFSAFMTRQRDLFYHGLSVASARSRENFRKGLTNAGFLIILIVIIEIAFFFLYDPVSAWLTRNFGSDESTWRIAILFANIIVLIEPSRRLANFMHMTIRMIEKGRNMVSDSEDMPKIYNYLTTLTIGSFITVVIVILVPNGIPNIIHILVILIVFALILLYQVYKNKKEMEKTSSSNPDTEGQSEADTEDGSESVPTTDNVEEKEEIATEVTDE